MWCFLGSTGLKYILWCNLSFFYADNDDDDGDDDDNNDDYDEGEIYQQSIDDDNDDDYDYHLCPPGHSVQWVAPALLYVPFSHSTGPTAGLGHLEPAGHCKQLVEFSTAENDPLAQSWW